MALNRHALVKELKSLRTGRGLTRQALSRQPTLLAALGHQSLEDSYELLVRLLEKLGESEAAGALRNAYGLGMANPGVLTARRADLSTSSGRDPKTLAGYENQMIEELATGLLAREPDAEPAAGSHVIVTGAVQDLRLCSITVSVQTTQSDGDTFERSVEYVNREEARSLPAVLYQLPSDWRPERLTLAVRFDGTSPRHVNASVGRELLELMFATQGGSVPLRDEGLAAIEISRPQLEVLYCLFWS